MNIVVIGAGLAGANAVEELRTQGYTERHHPDRSRSRTRPYERPPLSKGLLLGSAEPDSVFVHDAAWYADQQVDLLTGHHGHRDRPGHRTRQRRRTTTAL